MHKKIDSQSGNMPIVCIVKALFKASVSLIYLISNVIQLQQTFSIGFCWESFWAVKAR